MGWRMVLACGSGFKFNFPRQQILGLPHPMCKCTCERTVAVEISLMHTQLVISWLKTHRIINKKNCWFLVFKDLPANFIWLFNY